MDRNIQKKYSRENEGKGNGTKDTIKIIFSAKFQEN